MPSEFKSFVDIITPEERFWIQTSSGARYLCRRMTRDDKVKIEKKVYPEGRAAMTAEISYINEFIKKQKEDGRSGEQMADEARKLGERLASLAADREEREARLDEAVIDFMVVDWEGIGSQGQPASCTSENKKLLPYPEREEIVAKVSSLRVARAEEEAKAAKEDLGN